MKNLVVFLRRRLQISPSKDNLFSNLETEAGENILLEDGFYLLLE